jgi:hypothetical protein
MIKMQWPIRVTAITYHPSGKKRTINRNVEGAGNARAAIKMVVERRSDSWLWKGVEITGLTPIGQVIKIIYE